VFINVTFVQELLYKLQPLLASWYSQVCHYLH